MFTKFPIKRKKIKIIRPEITLGHAEPESVLDETIYEDILGIVFDMSIVMERNPKTFSKLKEEEIRDFFLLILNSHFEGKATGETFNLAGKTDILIRVEGKNIFITECMIWHGEKSLTKKINQLLGYTSWRDNKIAIFIFNQNIKFSDVLEQVKQICMKHDCFKREHELKKKKLKEDTVYSFVFHQPKDEDRELILTVMAFNVPKIK